MNEKVHVSRYGVDRTLTWAQWLAEFMCERQAKAQKRTLPFEFWKVPAWDRPYRRQLAAAHALLRTYEPAAVLRAVGSREGAKAYSLAAPWLVPLFEKHQRAVLAEQRPPAAEAAPPPPAPKPDLKPYTPPPTISPGKSLLSKLEGLGTEETNRETPRRLPPDLRLPWPLEDQARWLGWRWEHAGGRWEVVPVDHRTGEKVDPGDPAAWSACWPVLTAFHDGGLDGIGFVVRPDDPFRVVSVADRVEAARLGGYAELSPDGKGATVWLEGKGTAAEFVPVTGHPLPEPSARRPAEQRPLPEAADIDFDFDAEADAEARRECG